MVLLPKSVTVNTLEDCCFNFIISDIQLSISAKMNCSFHQLLISFFSHGRPPKSVMLVFKIISTVYLFLSNSDTCFTENGKSKAHHLMLIDDPLNSSFAGNWEFLPHIWSWLQWSCTNKIRVVGLSTLNTSSFLSRITGKIISSSFKELVSEAWDTACITFSQCKNMVRSQMAEVW